MLNKLTFSPTHPRRAKTRRFPSFMLDSSQFSAYPAGDELLSSLWRAGENYCASGFLSPAASLDNLCELPKKLSSVRLLHP